MLVRCPLIEDISAIFYFSRVKLSITKIIEDETFFMVSHIVFKLYLYIYDLKKIINV